MNPCTLTVEDLQRVDQINSQVIGYSGTYHYAFFKGVLAQFPHIKSILILGVYHGRDICFMQDIAKRYGKTVTIIGVDKFEDAACEDWPEAKKGLNWNAAGFGFAPTVEKAWENCRSDFVQLVPALDADYLDKTERRFDFIYLDTSHDYSTVARQLGQVSRVCASPDTIIAGDDYSDTAPMEGASWGVRSAVRDGFSSHEVFADWIWISDASRLKR